MMKKGVLDRKDRLSSSRIPEQTTIDDNFLNTLIAEYLKSILLHHFRLKSSTDYFNLFFIYPSFFRMHVSCLGYVLKN
jgi:hypothetical protein